MVFLKRTVRGLLVALLMVAASGFASKANAAWGDIYCDIYNGNGDAVTKAISLYNESDPSNRDCKAAVRIFAAGTISIPSGLTITQAPPAGHSFGLAIRKCVSTGSTPEANCPTMNNTDVVFDASGYTTDGGDCPIKVYDGAKMDFLNFKLIVKNKDKAICTGGGQPIAPEDQTNNFAWIHNITICESSNPNCNPNATETNCADGVDNDGDGKTDCQDSDCSTSPACPSTETNCTDGMDNDHDGKIDCLDPDCSANPACATTETNCTDGVDNDGDGQIDCADSDCSANPACATTETNCTDGVDNDGDGQIDCADSDCSANPACATTESNCTDGVDNDGDGQIDCADSDCAANPACDDTDGDGILNTVDLCPTEAGTAENGGCPPTKCIGQVDHMPHTKTGVDEDGDGIDAACDSNDGGGTATTPPTCSLSAVVAIAGFDLTWTSAGGVSATLNDGTTDLSTDLNHAAFNVDPGVSSKTYKLTVNGSGGTKCVESIILVDGSPVPASPTCALNAAAASGGFDLTWTSMNGSTAALTEEGNVTPLSTDLNSAVAVHVAPVSSKHYTLDVLGAGGECSRTLQVTPAVSTTDTDGDHIPDSVDLCPMDAGTIDNGGCPPTKCIGQTDHLPHDKLGIDADGDGIDKACDSNDTPGSVPTPPTCDLVAVSAVTGFNLTWTSADGATATLSDGTTTLSSDLNHAVAFPVDPGVTPKTYTLSVNGPGGHCGDAITLVDGSPVPTAPTCDLTAVSASSGFDLTWTSSNGTTAALTEEGTVTPLSTDLNSSSAVHVTPASTKLYKLDVTGSGGVCSKGVFLSPGAPGGPDTDGDGIVDSVDNCPALASHDLTDTDGDGLGNPCDDDDDGDGILDVNDNCPLVPNHDQADLDGNGVGDACQIGLGGSVGNDSDGDGLPDDLEQNVFGTDPHNPDTDGDGLSDGEEVKSPFYPACGPTEPDCDHDGICDGPGTVTDGSGNIICQPFNGHGDNCELVSNGPNTPGISSGDIQMDSDGNGVGDICEGDMDGDGVPDDTDNCPFIQNKDQRDQDKNGIGDSCDPNFAFIKGGGGGGCGCRVDGGATSNGDAFGFLLMGLPLLVLRQLKTKAKKEQDSES